MKGFRINPDKKYVSIIIEGLEKGNSYNPDQITIRFVE